MHKDELNIRNAIIQKAIFMNESGINQGTSGNISVRYQNRMLITPSGIPYKTLSPEDIAVMPFDAQYGTWDGPYRPSTEWRFHLDILTAKPEVNAIVHAHPTFCTVLAIAHRSIPACHYMIAAFGGDEIRCSEYATFGTPELSKTALQALEQRWGCLLANHGSIALGENLDKAMWRAVELETIAKQYYYSLALPQSADTLLSSEEISKVMEMFKSYGLQPKGNVLH